VLCCVWVVLCRLLLLLCLFGVVFSVCCFFFFQAEDGIRDRDVVADRFAWCYVCAMPSCYSGNARLTNRDLFTASSARNTGAVYAKFPYLVFADDQSLLMPSWWKTVKKASKARRIIAGAYQKVEYFQVQSGQLINPNQIVVASYDCRWPQGSPTGAVKISGEQLYGCSFGIPKEYFLDVNGFDEICDPIGMEDAHLGMRLDWAGHEILYDRAMLTIELNDPKQAERDSRSEKEGYLIRERLNLPLDQLGYFNKLAQFGVYRRFFQNKPFDASWMVLDLLYGIGT